MCCGFIWMLRWFYGGVMGFKRLKKKNWWTLSLGIWGIWKIEECGFPQAEKHGKPIGKNGDTVGSSPQKSPTKYQVGIEFGNPIGMKTDDWGEWFKVSSNQTISKYTILGYPDVSGTSCSTWPILCGHLMMTSVGAFGFSCSLLFIVKVASEAPNVFSPFPMGKMLDFASETTL